MSEDRIEVVQAACGHFIPRPNWWPRQVTLKDALETFPTRFVTPRISDKTGQETLFPVVLCPDCTARLGEWSR